VIEIVIVGTTPPCAKCKRAEAEALSAASRFPNEVQVRKIDALGLEAQEFGLIVTPTVLINGETVASGRVMPEAQLSAHIASVLKE